MLGVSPICCRESAGGCSLSLSPAAANRPSNRYIFEVLALSEPLRLAEGASAVDLRRATAGKVLASGRLIGRYQRH